jgi:hypothetical protein
LSFQLTAGPITAWALKLTQLDWRDFKKKVSTLATLIGYKFHFIEQLGMEHEAELVEIDMSSMDASQPP